MKIPKLVIGRRSIIVPEAVPLFVKKDYEKFTDNRLTMKEVNRNVHALFLIEREFLNEVYSSDTSYDELYEKFETRYNAKLKLLMSQRKFKRTEPNINFFKEKYSSKLDFKIEETPLKISDFIRKHLIVT